MKRRAASRFGVYRGGVTRALVVLMLLGLALAAAGGLAEARPGGGSSYSGSSSSGGSSSGGGSSGGDSVGDALFLIELLTYLLELTFDYPVLMVPVMRTLQRSVSPSEK